MNTKTCEEAKKVGGAQKLLQFLEKLWPMFETLTVWRGTESSHLFGPSICEVPQCQDTLSAIIGFDQVVCALTPCGRGNRSRRLGMVSEVVSHPSHAGHCCWVSYHLNFSWCGSISKVFRLLCLISTIIQQLRTAWTGHQPGRQGLKGTKLLEVGRW